MASVRALTFVLSHRKDGRGLGHALVCADARYASVAWRDAEWLDRRFVEPAEWRMFLFALRHGMPNTALDPTHVIPQILLPADRRSDIVVRLVASLPLDVAPNRVTEQLDEWLRDLARPSACHESAGRR